MHSMHGASGIWCSMKLPSNTEHVLTYFLYLWPVYHDCNLCIHFASANRLVQHRPKTVKTAASQMPSLLGGLPLVTRTRLPRHSAHCPVS